MEDQLSQAVKSLVLGKRQRGEQEMRDDKPSYDVKLPTYEEHMARVEKALRLRAIHATTAQQEPESLLRLIQGDISGDEKVQREPLARNAHRMQLAQIGWDEARLALPVLDPASHQKADHIIQRLLANRFKRFENEKDTTFCAARRDDFEREQANMARLLSDILSPAFKSILGEHGRCAELKRIPNPASEALSRSGIYLSIIETDAATSDVISEQPRLPSSTTSSTGNTVYYDVYIGSAYGELGCGRRLAYYDRFLQSCREGTLSGDQLMLARRHPHLRALMQQDAKVSMRLLGTIPDDVHPGVVYLLEGLCIDLVQTMITNAVPGSSSQAVLDAHHAMASLETGQISDVNGLNHVHPFMQGTRSDVSADDVGTGLRRCDMCLESPVTIQWYEVPKLDARSSGLLCGDCRALYIECAAHMPYSPENAMSGAGRTWNTRVRATNAEYASRSARDEPLMVDREWKCPCCHQYRPLSKTRSFLAQWPEMPVMILEKLSNELTDGITSWCAPCSEAWRKVLRQRDYDPSAFVSQRRALTAISNLKIKCPRCGEALKPESLLGHLKDCQGSAEELGIT